VAWLKTKENVSETIRAMVTEAMNLDRLKASVKAGPRSKAKPARKAGSSKSPTRG